MRSSVIRWLVLSSAGLASAAAGVDAAGTPTWKDAFYYQFRYEPSAVSSEVVEGRIEYQVEGRTLHEMSVAFRPAADGTATFVVPDPSVAGGPGAAVVVNVYAGDTLVDSFDRKAFAAYNARLKASAAGTLRRLFAASRRSDPPSERPAADLTVQGPPQASTAPVVAAGVTAAVLLDPCITACRREYRACIVNCGIDNCSCDQEFQSCLAGCPNADVDGDGVINSADNCLETYNPDQADCDGDGAGNVCDRLNARYQMVQSEKTCMTDKDNHVVYFDFEHHVEKRERDVSACGAPDRWTRRIRDTATCFGISDSDCCMLLAVSIRAVNDDPVFWCSSTVRDRNFCH